MMKASARTILYFLIIMFVLSLSSVLFAQDLQDLKGVKLHNGTVIYGKVIESNVNQVIIEKKDGNRVMVKFDDVSDFLKDEQAAGTTNQNKSFSAAHPDQPAGPDTLKRQKHFFVLAHEISYIKYDEPGVMEEKGMMYGIFGSYAYRNKLMLKAEGKFAYGQVDYDGATWGGTPLTIKSIPNYMLEFRGLLGYDIAAKAITITPYLGFGYRWLQDNTQNKSLAGYKREANYLYLPIGVEAVTILGNGWSLGANVEYDAFLWGKQKSYLSDVDPGYNDIENKQTSGYGFRGSISIVKKGKRVGFIIEPYVKYWNIGGSDIELVTYYGSPYDYGQEPKNISTEIGCKLAVMF
jgi:hypothetical protein